mgnify:CR=1 FL=1
MNVKEISYYPAGSAFCPDAFGKELSELIEDIRREEKKEDVLYLCIGSDRSTGDSLGPLIGYMLQKESGLSTAVLGTLTYPVHAVNLEEALTQIETEFSDSIVVAIDASVCKREHIGCITLGRGSIKPGLGVSKDLAEVGDIFITGIVGACGRFEPLMLQNTRLSMVMEMADCICRGIGAVENFCLEASRN